MPIKIKSRLAISKRSQPSITDTPYSSDQIYFSKKQQWSYEFIRTKKHEETREKSFSDTVKIYFLLLKLRNYR